MSEQPLVTIMLPTRNRVHLLGQSVDSLYSLAKDKSRLEFIFKTDDDDPKSAEWVRWMASQDPNLKISLLTTPRGRGYHDMHRWVNAMCDRASGKWLFIWNDDARMETQDWDEHLAMTLVSPWHGQEDITAILAPSIGRPQAQEFLFLNRKVFELLGHWSLSPHNDNWIYWVMHAVRSVGMHPTIKVHHFSEQMTDDTRKESEEAYKTTAQDTLNAPWAIERRVLDAAKILEYLHTKVSYETWVKGYEKR